MTVNNLIANGGFEKGNLRDWTTLNTSIVRNPAHSGNYAAKFNTYGPAAIVQSVPISSGENFLLLVSFSKQGLLPSPDLTISVTYQNSQGAYIGHGLNMSMPSGRLPNSLLKNWLEIYQVIDSPPEGTYQVTLEIRKQDNGTISASTIIDDIQLLQFDGSGTEPPGPTGPTGTNM